MKHNQLFFIICITCLLTSCKPNTSSKDSTARAQGSSIRFISNNLRGTEEAPVFTEQFSLNKDPYLSLEFTLAQPLITSLKALAPNLSVDELLDKGNFQYSFMVDGNRVYVENLNKGAGLKPDKTTELTHRVPLITPEPIDFWGWYMWLKFMKMGDGRDALSTGKHQLTIEIRPYLNDGTLKVGPLLAQGSIAVSVADMPYDEGLVPIQPIQPTPDWPISKDSYNQDTLRALNKKIAQRRFEHINGIVVVKNGALLVEEYFNGEARDSLHDPRSVGKSFASTMMGIAINEHYIRDEYSTLKDYYKLKNYANYSPKKEQVTLKSLLTMSSGFVGDDSDMSSIGNEELMYPTANWVQFALDLPMDANKTIGEDYSYFTAGAVLLGDIIDKSVPDGLVAYADKKLFKPLNITNYQWEYTPQHVGNTAGGIRLRAIDFAKYGQLYKNKGLWNGQQLISPEWVEKSLSKQVVQPHETNGTYGYLFWNKTYTVNGKAHEVSFCTGNGGNKIFIFKDLPLVVVITSSAYNLPYAHTDVDKMMTQYILPAVAGH
jgi:CubicO group peptidase (beta-lactamase class C family)